MKLSKIQLLSSQLLKVSVTPKLKSAGGAPSRTIFHYSKDSPEFEHMVRIKEMAELEKAIGESRPELKGIGYRVDCGLRITEEHKNYFPYLMEIIVSGVFFAETVEKDGVEGPENPDLVTQYAASILYSQIRDLVNSLTSRMRWGQFCLPIASFMDLKFEDVKISEPTAQVAHE